MKTPDHEELASAQVDAFMRIIEERFDLDEKRVKTLAQRAATNGKVYLTYSVIVGVLLMVVGYFYVRDAAHDDDRYAAIQKHLEQIEAKQTDVRERLRLIEEKLR